MNLDAFSSNPDDQEIMRAVLADLRKNLLCGPGLQLIQEAEGDGESPRFNMVVLPPVSVPPIGQVVDDERKIATFFQDTASIPEDDFWSDHAALPSFSPELSATMQPALEQFMQDASQQFLFLIWPEILKSGEGLERNNACAAYLAHTLWLHATMTLSTLRAELNVDALAAHVRGFMATVLHAGKCYTGVTYGASDLDLSMCVALDWPHILTGKPGTEAHAIAHYFGTHYGPEDRVDPEKPHSRETPYPYLLLLKTGDGSIHATMDDEQTRSIIHATDHRNADGYHNVLFYPTKHDANSATTPSVPADPMEIVRAILWANTLKKQLGST